MNEKLIFISCGQQTEEETAMGGSVKELVDTTPGFKGYFAEYVQELDSLAKNILDALRRCSGFIAFLHKRGKVTDNDGNEWGQRSSVWINQEIAILAYRQYSEGIKFPILIFKDEAVKIVYGMGGSHLKY